MFFFFFGMLCGIVLCQEVPGIPKVKPYLKNAWAKINPPSSEAASAVNESDDGQASNKSD
jgi:hypothetical protein